MKHFGTCKQILLLFLVFLFLGIISLSAQKVQNIRGVILDKNSKQPLIGATVEINGLSLGTTSDENGVFLIEKVPLGRHSITSQYLGYQPSVTEGIVLTSVREAYIEILMSQGSVNLDDIIITGSRNAFESVNPLTVVSSRSFTAEETARIPAGVNDPGRAALSYPGVQKGNDESENTIIVRGNAPQGILWRLEGIDIPNPNHFALIGSSGGGITIFSAQLLAKSDFLSGGMPAEYGNAISGAFDVQFRPGNLEKRNHFFKMGVIGLDFSTEGPIQKGKSSYLINYRYSTLSILNKVGFYLNGPRVLNDFQDLSFNLHFQTKNPKLKATVFGLGGLSLEEYLPVDNSSERNPLFFDHREFQHKPARIGTVGTTWTYLGNKNYYIKGVVALMNSDIRREYDTLNTTNNYFRYHTEKYNDTRISAALTYNHEINPKLRIKSGLIFHQIFFDFYRDRLPVRSLDNILNVERNVSVNGNGNTQTIQQYTQASYKLSSELTINGGYHFLRLNANGTQALDPRVSLQYQVSPRQKLSFAAGQHSQTLAMMTYYFTDKSGKNVNKNLDLMKSWHYVGAYHFYTASKMKLSMEGYFQTLHNIPVSTDAKDKYWLLNNTNGYPLFQATSNGTGQNKGIDLGIEKLFSRSYFLLATFSFINSTFTPADGKTYNSRWNAGFSSAYTIGKEFNLGKSRVLQIGGRLLMSGGGRYTPFDPVLSRIAGTYVASNAEFGARLPAYWRIDSRIQYRFNANKVAGNVSLDLQNTTNRINASGVSYDAVSNTTSIRYRGGGFIPVLAFQVEF